MLCKFRRIARARSEEEIKHDINELRNCDYWKRGYENLVNWFQKQWIPLRYIRHTLVAYTKDVISISHIDLCIIYKFVYTLFYLCFIYVFTLFYMIPYITL